MSAAPRSRVLIVDDERVIRAAWMKMLPADDFEVSVAEDGAEGSAWMRLNYMSSDGKAHPAEALGARTVQNFVQKSHRARCVREACEPRFMQRRNQHPSCNAN